MFNFRKKAYKSLINYNKSYKNKKIKKNNKWTFLKNKKKNTRMNSITKTKK
jgi:hypothetical protein